MSWVLLAEGEVIPIFPELNTNVPERYELHEVVISGRFMPG